MEKLKPFQGKFLRACLSDKFNVLALSMPRGNGKSYMAARLIYELIWPESKNFVNGDEVGLMAANLSQARIVFRYLRDWLEETGLYSFQDSSNKLGITLKAKPGQWKTTKLTAFSSDGKGAMGIVKMPWVVCDEPGAWEVNKGALMAEALFGALGKPGSRLRLLFIGTLAPARAGWWIDLVMGGTKVREQTYVQLLQGNRKKWNDWNEIRKCNPLITVDKKFHRQLKIDRDKALHDSRLKAFFLSYRLNLPTGDESDMLLNLDDWDAAIKRKVQPREGNPVVGVDLGSGRAWSAAVAIWRNGRTEAFAVAPGIPSVEQQEKRDIVPPGTYQKLVDSGRLVIQDGHKVQEEKFVAKLIENKWPDADKIVCDRFRSDVLEDYVSMPVEPRVTQWAQITEDIRALRKWTKDGPMNIEKESRKLITASLMVAMVQNDNSGNTRLIKRGSNNQARDDVAFALTLGAGEAKRQAELPDLETAFEIIRKSQ